MGVGPLYFSSRLKCAFSYIHAAMRRFGAQPHLTKNNMSNTQKENITITTEAGNVRGFLKDAAKRIAASRAKNLGENPLFPRDVQTLDGFRVGFMEPLLFEELCVKHNLSAEQSEAILMQTDVITDPHVHLKGESVFLPLGETEGYPDSRGGTFLGAYREGADEQRLRHVPAKPGKTFRVPAGKVHFFAPKEGGTLSAIAFVSPRIQQPDGSFDMRHFTSPVIDADGKKAVVRETAYEREER